MPDHLVPDEGLRDRTIGQALAGDISGARQTIGGMADRRYVSEAWRAILTIQTYRGDVEGVEETIISCPDNSLLYSHQYRELPLDFARAGDVSGAIAIAKAMGSWGKLPLLMIPLGLAEKGDFVAAREAMSQIENEADRNMIEKCVDERQRKNSPEKSGQH